MALTIYDLVKAPDITAYWETFSQDREPYPLEAMFPNDKKLGLDLSWIKGAEGRPAVLKASAFDAVAVPRPRIGFDRLTAQMPFFKESLYVDEVIRQQLNIVLETGNQAYIDSVMGRVFKDDIRLIEGAAARREQMRMMALTTGTIAMASNGQAYSYDYGMPAGHRETVETSWSDASADILGDLQAGIDKIEEDTGVRVTRGMCNLKVWNYIRKNTDISKAVFTMGNGTVQPSDAQIRTLLMERLGLEIMVNSKRYVNDSGDTVPYMPDDTFVLFPAGQLGTTWFGTTPEESDLMASGVANVAITDTGVAVTTIEMADPVNVTTKVTMITLPSFEAADQVYIIDVTA